MRLAAEQREERLSAHRCLINVINHWVNNYEVSWDTVTNALDGIDCRNMAETIRMKYNIVLLV